MRNEDGSFSLSSKELEENCEDTGTMFCEDCHKWHVIDYKLVPFDSPVKIGTYHCEGMDYIWSINGRRVD